MIPVLHCLILSLALAGFLLRLLAPRGEGGALGSFFALAVFAALSLFWVFHRGLDLSGALWLALGAEAAGAVSFALARTAPGGALPGAAAGLLFCALGACGWQWRELLAALARLGFAGVFFGALLPFFLALSLALAAAALLHEGLRRQRAALLVGLVLLWAGSAALTARHLRAAWDYPRMSLSQAAQTPEAPEAVADSVAVLVHGPSALDDFRLERRLHAVDRLDAGPRSLDKIRRYLDGRGFRSLFKREGLSVLRQGWLGHWEAEKALEAAALSVPGLVDPDYLLALGLLRAGPLTEARFQELEKLHAAAMSGTGGFEDVNRSQKIFEAFSAAYGRFGDEDRSRYWLGRVDDLWPLYDKKIEVSSVETMRDGSISGSLLLDGRPASSVRVGLFLETRSQATGKKVEELSGGVFPDSEGRFGFADLGPGGYHLELMGTAEQLKGAIENAPGLIELFEGRREAVLPPILIERRAKRPPHLPGLDPLLMPERLPLRR